MRFLLTLAATTRFLTGAALTGTVWTCSVQSCHAQAFYGGEVERALRPGVYTPYDGMPWSHRYNYEIGPILYFNKSARELYTLEYLDRLDRAEKFGYAPPRDPFGHHEPVVVRPARVGFGLGIFRWR
ncbi:MAG: hypothetical protein L0Y72_04025 [Gemmataceae bacterium]|nr:hypothetical protein [Gemmataceae bacterium]MCI0738187.1 hypothetical protein [Gemmataceae bacterium]